MPSAVSARRLSLPGMLAAATLVAGSMGTPARIARSRSLDGLTGCCAKAIAAAASATIPGTIRRVAFGLITSMTSLGAGSSLRFRVGRKARLLDAVGANRLVLVAGAATRTRGADDRAARVADQHTAGLRQELAVRRRGQRHEEIRVVLGAACECAARRTHRDRGPRFAGRDVEAEHAR